MRDRAGTNIFFRGGDENWRGKGRAIYVIFKGDVDGLLVKKKDMRKPLKFYDKKSIQNDTWTRTCYDCDKRMDRSEGAGRV